MSSNILVSAAVGLGCAVCGALANPKAPSRQNTGRAVIVAMVAVAPVLACIVWRGQVTGTLLPALAGSLVSEIRNRFLSRAARQSSTEPKDADVSAAP
jgi:hypothetical protein